MDDLTESNAGPMRRGKSKGKTFQCSGFGDCAMTFTRSEHLARHIRKHTGERPFSCHCGRTFSRLDNLRQHAQTVHAKEITSFTKDGMPVIPPSSRPRPVGKPSGRKRAQPPLHHQQQQQYQHQQHQQHYQEQQQQQEQHQHQHQQLPQHPHQQQHQLNQHQTVHQQQHQQDLRQMPMHPQQQPLNLPDIFGDAGQLSPASMGLPHGYRGSPYAGYDINGKNTPIMTHHRLHSGMSSHNMPSSGWVRNISTISRHNPYNDLNSPPGTGQTPAGLMFESLIDPELVADDEADARNRTVGASNVMKKEEEPSKKHETKLRDENHDPKGSHPASSKIKGEAKPAESKLKKKTAARRAEEGDDADKVAQFPFAVLTAG